MFPQSVKQEHLISFPNIMDGSEIDLRKETEYILNKYGLFVLLRRNFKIHCSCYKSVNGDYNSKCSLCGGTGFINRIEKHLARKIIGVSNRTLVQNLNDAEFSRIMVDAYKFYFHYYVNPQIQDLIYVVTWDGDKPSTLVAEYEIVNTDDMRGDNGRIEYWQAYCRSRVIGSKPFKKMNIRRLRTEDVDMSYEDASIQYDVVW